MTSATDDPRPASLPRAACPRDSRAARAAYQASTGANQPGGSPRRPPRSVALPPASCPLPARAPPLLLRPPPRWPGPAVLSCAQLWETPFPPTDRASALPAHTWIGTTQSHSFPRRRGHNRVNLGVFTTFPTRHEVNEDAGQLIRLPPSDPRRFTLVPTRSRAVNKKNGQSRSATAVIPGYPVWQPSTRTATADCICIAASCAEINSSVAAHPPGEPRKGTYV